MAVAEIALMLAEDYVTKPFGTEETHYLRVHAAHVRRKLERDPARPEIVVTDAGVGYRLAPDP